MTDQETRVSARDSADVITLVVSPGEHAMLLAALDHKITYLKYARSLHAWRRLVRLRDELADVQFSPSETEPRDTASDTHVA